LEKVPWDAEKNVYSVTVGRNILKMTFKSIQSVVSVNSEVSFLNFCLDDLSNGESGILKLPTMIVLGVYLSFYVK
jgi:hypothetical protein